MNISTISKSINRAEWVRDIWSLLFLILMVLFFEIWAQVSYSSSFVFNGFNVQSILIFATAPLLLGIGQSLVIISGGIDLSVGFIMGLSAVVLATIVQSFSGEAQGVALAIGILATCLVCLIPGLINGLLITKLKVPPFIGTLGMYGVARGSGFIIADGMTVPVDNDWLYNLGTGKILGIPINRVKTLVNTKADEAGMLLATKRWLARAAKQGKTDVYIFFAGHGLASDDGSKMYLLPYDGAPELLDDTAILRDRLFSDVAAANPRSVTVFLDTCYSGTTRAVSYTHLTLPTKRIV